MIVGPLLWLACSGDGGPKPVEDGVSRALRALPPRTLELPAANRDGLPPRRIPLSEWSSGRGRWVHPMPVRPRSMFFHRPKPGMRVFYDEEEIPFGNGPKSWDYNGEQLFLRLPDGLEPGDRVTFEYPKALERELRLHREMAVNGGLTTPQGFTDYQMQEGFTSRSGLLLNAPGRVAWELELPPSAELHFVPTLAQPEILDQPPSDGAELVVTLEVEGVRHEVHRESVALHQAPYRRIDLSAWSNQRATLEIQTLPGGTSVGDHVFLAEPVVASRKVDPRTVLMVFIDTLRPDHMSLYGYERDTTGAIDHLAQEGAVFENARSIAPWTLPSARTIVTGMQPESYEEVRTLQETLRDEGWATAFIAGNVYLSANFDMHRGWDYHTVGMWPLAEVATDEALAWLDERAGRDVLLQVHYMGVHLPYKEPRAYRHMYAGEGPDTLREEFHLPALRAARLKSKEDRQYVRDRYDNNVRYVTDQVQRLVARLDDNDVLVLFADHGEEFWDHGGLEHGHTVYDELLRVPLVIRGPGVPAGRIDAPVSLLDITPTILELVGVDPPQALDGASLVPLARGEAEADARFRARSHAFGRPLYGHERWGVITPDGQKWTTHEGEEQIFDLAADPRERRDLFRPTPTDAGAPFRAAMAEAVGFDVDVSYRLMPTQNRGGQPPPDGLEMICIVPGGIKMAWAGEDPLENADLTTEALAVDAAWDRIAALAPTPPVERFPLDEGAEALSAHWYGGGPQELYLTPETLGTEPPPLCVVSSCPDGRCQAFTLRPEAGRTWPDADRAPLAKAQWGQRRGFVWGWGMAPADPRTIRARDDESNEALEALGYKNPDEPDDDAPATPPGKVMVRLFFADADGRLVAEEREVGSAEPIKNAVFQVLKKGPTAPGLTAPLNGIDGFHELEVADGVASLRLKGACTPGPRPDVADLLTETLKAFDEVDHVRIVGPGEAIPDASDHRPACLGAR